MALEVVGSTPTTHPRKFYQRTLGCRQAVRHGILIPASRRFDPFHPSQTKFINYGPLAQSVEHLTFNQVVPRSIRGWITNKNLLAIVAELADAPDLGSGISDVGVQVSSVAPHQRRTSSALILFAGVAQW